MFLNKAVVFALESEKAPDKKLFVEVDRAIEQGEIVVNMPEPVIKCEEMTLEQMFICCVRVNKLPIDDKVVLNYISAVSKELGQECRRDQFKFRKLKEEYQARLEKGMADFDFAKTYFIKVNNNHKGYDFDHKGYLWMMRKNMRSGAEGPARTAMSVRWYIRLSIIIWSGPRCLNVPERHEIFSIYDMIKIYK